MKINRTLPALAAVSAAFALSTAASSAAYVIYGPTNISVPTTGGTQPDVDATTVTTSQLNGEDQLFITYGVTRKDLTFTGDAWLGLAINDNGEGVFDFNGGGESDLGFLIRTINSSSPSTHAIFNQTSGSWDATKGGNTSVDIDGATPATHQVRLTISGLATGGFKDSHAFTLEIDHNASTFATADRLFSGVMSFATRAPATDEGLRLEFKSNNAGHDVSDFKVFQADAVPEPSTALLGGLGLLALLRRRR